MTRLLKKEAFPVFFSRKKPVCSYDPAARRPAIRCSICTGEQVAGFINSEGHFEDIQLIRTPQDLDAFRTQYSIPPDCNIEKIY